MTLASAFYDGLDATDEGIIRACSWASGSIAAAFNWASGTKALHDRGLHRPVRHEYDLWDGLDQDQEAVNCGVGIGAVVGMAVALVLQPPLMIALAAVITAPVVGGLIPEWVQAACIIRKAESKQKKAPLVVGHSHKFEC